MTDSEDKVFTHSIKSAVKDCGIVFPLIVFFKSPWSVICKSKSAVFCPCSARTGPLVMGVVLKS